MIPIPMNQCIEIEVENEKDETYKMLEKKSKRYMQNRRK